MRYTLKPLGERESVLLVGCGGTGGFVAEGLCRLFRGTEHNLILIDHDRVEERNIGRQSFYPGDLGKFKSQVLAERLAAQFGVAIEYDTRRIESLPYGWRGDLTIGCVDNRQARRRLEVAGMKSYIGGPAFSYCEFGGWYIDAGNGEYSGQVLIGNALLRECPHGFTPAAGICTKLPLPTIQQPALLAPESRPGRRRDCAAAVAADEQSPVINRMMADLVLVFVHKLLRGTLQWMGAYIDLETGSVNFVDAAPEPCSRMTGLTVRQLEHHPREKHENRIRVRI